VIELVNTSGIFALDGGAWEVVHTAMARARPWAPKPRPSADPDPAAEAFVQFLLTSDLERLAFLIDAEGTFKAGHDPPLSRIFGGGQG